MNSSPRREVCRGPYFTARRPVSRRHFLTGTGTAMALPFLDSMLPGRARAAAPATAPLTAGASPRRMFAICNNLGLLREHLFPTGAGRDYVPSLYLDVLQKHRDDFSVFSGVSHPNVEGGHPADVC